MLFILYFFFFMQKTAYEMRISDWSSDVCSSDLHQHGLAPSYPAPHIEPPWRRGRTAQHFPMRAPARRRSFQFLLQCVESLGGGLLIRVSPQFFSYYELLIALKNACHRRD